MAKVVLKENEVEVGEGKIYLVKPVKMKYIRDKFYTNYLYLKKEGLMKVLTHYTDGHTVVEGFLTSVFDSEIIAKEVAINLDTKSLNEIILITMKLNQLADEVEIKNGITPDVE